MKINKSFIRIALAVGLVGLAACSGSSSSSRNRNSTMEDGSICFTEVERAGLIENAAPRVQQDAVKAQPEIPAQPAVVGQVAIAAQAGIPAQLAPFEIPAVADQPEVLFQAAVPDQPEVPAQGEYWYHTALRYTFDTGSTLWMANHGFWPWIDDHHIMTNTGEFTLQDAKPFQPAVKGTPEVPHQDAVPGHRAYHKGEEITVAIPEIVGQPEIKAQAAVAAQPEILAREEIKGATKEEVIAEINAVKSCTETTVPSPAIPSPTIELSYESGKGSEKIAKLSWTPDAADTEEYSVVIKQNGMDDTDGVSVKGKGEFSSAPLNPGCTDVGEFIVTRKSDDQLMAIIDFNYPDQDFTDCEPVIPENTVVNETTTTDAPVVEVTTTDAPKAIAEVTTLSKQRL